MRKILGFSILFIVALVSVKPLAYGMSAEERKSLRHITAQQAYILFKQSKILILDVHPRPNKKKASIIGANYLPSNVIKKSKIKIPKNTLIGVYCD